MIRIRVMALAAVVSTGSGLFAQGVTLKEHSVALVTKAELSLRDAPPSGPFYSAGQKIGVIPKGATVVAIGEKNVNTLFGEYKWLQVNVVDPKTLAKKSTGWVYVGSPQGETYVEPSRVEAVKK